MASSNPERRDPQSEKEKTTALGEKDGTTSNQFNVLNVEEGEIIMNEAILVEYISEPRDPLAGNNIPSSSPREDQTDTTMGDSSTLGGSWA